MSAPTAPHGGGTPPGKDPHQPAELRVLHVRTRTWSEEEQERLFLQVPPTSDDQEPFELFMLKKR